MFATSSVLATTVLAAMTAAMSGPIVDPPSLDPAATPPPAIEAGLGLTLDDAIRRSLAHSPALTAARAQTEGSEAEIASARRAFLPRLSLEQTVSRSNNPVYVFGSLLTQRAFTESNFALDALNQPDALTNHQTGLVLEQSLYDGGRRILAVRDARHHRDMTLTTRREVEMQIVFATIRAYFGIGVHQAAVDLLDSTLATAAADLDRSEAHAVAGLATAADVLAVRVHRAELEARRIQAANELELAHAELATLLGIPLDQRLLPRDSLDGQAKGATEPTQPMSELEQIALAERPDQQRAAIRERLAAIGRSRARSSLWPAIGLRAGREWDRPALFDEGGANWMVAVNARLDLFDGLERYALMAAAAAAADQARADAELVAESARLEVRRAALNLRAARAQVAVSSEVIALAQESSRITAERYAVGLGSVTELLRARNALLAVETRRLDALYQERLAAAGLERALGTLAARPQDGDGSP